MSFDESLEKVSQSLRRSSLHRAMPARMESRLMSVIPEIGQAACKVSARTILPRTIGFSLIVSAIAVGFAARFRALPQAARIPYVGPRVITKNAARIDPTLPVQAKVRAAVNEANTWHISLHYSYDKSTGPFDPQGRAKPSNERWEIWARRKPFFYREERGGETVLDDGIKRYHLIPAQVNPADQVRGIPSSLSPEIMVIRPSAHYYTFGVGEFGDLLIGNNPVPRNVGSSEAVGSITITKSTKRVLQSSKRGKSDARTVTIESEMAGPKFYGKTDLSIDSRTSLPNRYTYVTSFEPNICMSEDFAPTYNCLIPPYLMKMRPKPEAIVFDASGREIPAGTGVTHEATLRGLVLRAEPIDLGADTDHSDIGAASDVVYTHFWELNRKRLSELELMTLLPITTPDIKVLAKAGEIYLGVASSKGVPTAAESSILASVEPCSAGHNDSSHLVQVQAIFNLNGSDRNRRIEWDGPDVPMQMPLRMELTLAKNALSARNPAIRTARDLAVLRERVAAARSDYYLRGVAITNEKLSDSPNNPGLPKRVHRQITDVQRLTPERYARAIYWTNAAAIYADQAGLRGVAHNMRWKLECIPKPH